MNETDAQTVGLILKRADEIIASNLQEWINAFVQLPLSAGQHLGPILRNACDTLLKKLPPPKAVLNPEEEEPQKKAHELKPRLIAQVEKAIDQVLAIEQHWQAEIKKSDEIIAKMDSLTQMSKNLTKLTSAYRYNELGSSANFKTRLPSEKEMISKEMKEKRAMITEFHDWASKDDGLAATISKVLNQKEEELRQEMKVLPVRWTGWQNSSAKPEIELMSQSLVRSFKPSRIKKMVWKKGATSEIRLESGEEDKSACGELEKIQIEVSPRSTFRAKFLFAGGREKLLLVENLHAKKHWSKTIQVHKGEHLVKIKVNENHTDFNLALARVD